MKFFSCVATKIKGERLSDGGPVRRSRFSSAFVVALAGLACVGCVGRKQYAINEAILISERRQLEDEIYRLQFELRDALEENERLRQGQSGNAKTGGASASGANNAFFPGLDATQTRLRTTGGAKKVATPTANVLETGGAPQNANSAPATGEAIETLPDYVPIPVTATQPDASRPQRAPLAQNAPERRTVRSAQNVGKTLGVRRVLPVAASNESGGEVVASVFVDAPSTSPEVPQAPTSRSSSGDGWAPLAQ